MVLVSYILENSTSILQTKFHHREGHEARRVRPETMPLDQHIGVFCPKRRKGIVQHIWLSSPSS